MRSRELAIALGARVTWLTAALAALLVGHGFVLAIDIYSSESRSALASALLLREMDPLAGVVRPMLGGLELATALLVPVVAARVLAIEKERGSFRALALQVGSARRVLAAKAVAAVAAASLFLIPALLLVSVFAAVGGHVDAGESGVALLGHALHALLVSALALAAAAWTESVALAATLAIGVSLASWAIDASEGFAALTWLGGAARWSVSTHLASFDRGILDLGDLAWFVLAGAGAGILALVGGRFDWEARTRAMAGGLAATATVALLFASGQIHRAFDCTESARRSFPPAVTAGLRAVPAPLAIDVYLDREDSRRRQLESDVLAKIRLARADVVLRTPLDEATVARATDANDARYGVIAVQVGSASRETRASSAEEIVALVFEAAGRPSPSWTQPEYPGYPVSVEGTRRGVVLAFAYLALPLTFAACGLFFARPKRRRS